jgi:inward rectifier potassium channel
MLRMANERHTVISEATAALWVSLLETTQEGIRMRRFHELRLEREQNPLFALSWTLFHAIDTTSPLYNRSEADLQKSEALFVVTFSGTDDTASQSLNARQTYGWQDIRWHHSYRDILHTDENGQSHIDYRYFHDTQKQDLPPTSAV